MLRYDAWATMLVRLWLRMVFLLSVHFLLSADTNVRLYNTLSLSSTEQRLSK